METIKQEKLIPFLHSLYGGWGGYANGYVAVPPSHPLYGLSHDKVEVLFNVHGGLTFSDFMGIVNDERWSLEFLGDYGEIPDNWWVFGFDTQHYGDDNLDRNYCVAETLKLKKQLENKEFSVNPLFEGLRSDSLAVKRLLKNL